MCHLQSFRPNTSCYTRSSVHICYRHKFHFIHQNNSIVRHKNICKIGQSGFMLENGICHRCQDFPHFWSAFYRTTSWETGVVTYEKPAVTTNQRHSAYLIPHFTFRIPQFRILPTVKSKASASTPITQCIGVLQLMYGKYQTFFRKDAPFSHNTYVTDDRRSISTTVTTVVNWKLSEKMSSLRKSTHQRLFNFSLSKYGDGVYRQYTRHSYLRWKTAHAAS